MRRSPTVITGPLVAAVFFLHGCSATMPAPSEPETHRPLHLDFVPARPPVEHPAFVVERPFTAGRPLAHVAMIQWIGPIVWRSYGAEWNLLFHLHLAQRGKDDDYNDPPGSVASRVLGFGAAPWNLLRVMPADTLRPALHQLLDNPLWFYTVWSHEKRPTWYTQNTYAAVPRALVGVPLDENFWSWVAPDAFPRYRTDVPDPSAMAWVAEQRRSSNDRMTEDIIERWIVRRIYGLSEGNYRKFNPRNDRPTVTADAGDRAVGFTSLARALRYLEANPQKPVWLLSFDAQDYLAGVNRPTENGVWLVLTHPDYNVHPHPRRPLAAIYAPQRVALADVPQRSRAQAHRKAMSDALAAAGVAPTDAGMFFHDAGEGDAGQRALQPTLQAIATLGITEDTVARLNDIERYVKNPGAVAAPLNLAFATAWTHHRGRAAVVVATRDEDAVYAVTVAPPAGHVVPARTEWGRVRNVGRANWPWWGPRINP